MDRVDRLSGQVVLVSGAARGMGAACARRLVADGAAVVAGDVRRDDVSALAGELGPRCAAVTLDVVDPESWASAVEVATTRFGELSALINNAGILRRTPIADGDVDAYRQLVDVNQLGVYLGMRAVAPSMTTAGRGAIVNVSSIDGLLGMAGLAGYVSTKWAVRGMTKVAALELGPSGVRCNSVHPGYIDTPMLTVEGRMREETKRRLAAQVPGGTMGTPDDIAAVCAFLVSDDSRYVNGAEIVVDGGLIAGIHPAGA
ncbi:MAG: SDR family NAD(P)-dependent oxidoreductase [Solirubrobacteraceae bacterium]